MTQALNIPLTTRNAGMQDLVAILRQQHDAKRDLVASVSKVRARDGRLIIDDAESSLSPDGVSSVPGVYTPTAVCDQGIADKLGIPSGYLRKTREQAPELYDENVNGWLRRADPSNKYLVRALSDRDGGTGVARAFLSDNYKMIDHLDTLMAALSGVRESGMAVTIDGCDLTDRRMIVRIRSEEIRSLAPTLLRNYRSPFTGETGADNPTVFAGFVLTNSETGCGAFNIVPRITVQVCNNGMTISKDALRAVHLGGKLDEGIIRWSEQTHQRNLALIAAQARDFVAEFLNREYVERKIIDIEAQAGRPVADPEQTIKIVSQRLRFTENQQKDILAHFIKGADLTAGGVMHAVTSTAQILDDADASYEMEHHGLKAMEIAAAL